MEGPPVEESSDTGIVALLRSAPVGADPKNDDVPIRCLDLFCGIGGLALGFERAGIRSVGGVDHWQDAARTFEHNLGRRCLVSDLRTTTVEEMEAAFGVTRDQIDVVAGGPPCQGFSTVGKRDVSDPRNTLWENFLAVVCTIRPAYVLVENVEGLVVAKKGAVRRGIEDEFRRRGYRMKSQLVRSADYGVPQLRKRVVFLGWLDGLVEPSFPQPRTEDPVTVAEAIFDLPPLEAGQAVTDYTRAPDSDYQRARRGDSASLQNHEAAKHPPHLIEVLRHVPDGGNRKSIPDHLQPNSGFHNSYARLDSQKPAVAVTSNMRKPSSARATHPVQHRGLTVREGLRLQSFDDDFVPLGSRTSQYVQVGNAVPPLLGEAFGRALLEAYRGNHPAELRRHRRRFRRAPPADERQIDLEDYIRHKFRERDPAHVEPPAG